jgi:peptidoglycan hydrolase-like protein with peptidoglycan-binding domain
LGTLRHGIPRHHDLAPRIDVPRSHGASNAPTTTTQPETSGATGFTLPEGTKLQRDAENDAAVVRELQRALTAAGYDPGPADGTYGEQTEAAVVAFQQANGLSVDGRVGPETAAALNSALATG